MRQQKINLVLSIGMAFILSCQGPAGPPGLNSLIDIDDETPGSNCAAGGLLIRVGLDSNNDGQLSTSEVMETRYVCHGTNSITSLTDEAAGANCANGGVKLQVGTDVNGNMILDPTEVQASKYICNIEMDKLERLEVGNSSSGSNSTTFEIIGVGTNHLVKFNKMNYAGVQSITFMPSLSVSTALPDPQTGYAELYDVTHNVSIAGSQVQYTGVGHAYVESGNIYNALPAGEIQLAIRLRVDNSSSSVSTGLRSFIFIYKN